MLVTAILNVNFVEHIKLFSPIGGLVFIANININVF